MKKKFLKFCVKLTKAAIPLCGIAASLCMFVANSSPNLCSFIWAYEIDAPPSLRNVGKI